MKRINILLTLLAVLFIAPRSLAQTIVPEGYVLVDSLVYHKTASADKSLYGHDIFTIMPSRDKGDAGDVRIHQDDEIVAAMHSHVSSNSGRALRGYRVRLFFSNKQNARQLAAAAYGFAVSVMKVPAYITYNNPFFKVTAGDFRTKAEAVKFLNEVKPSYPSAFIVRENIKLPSVYLGDNFIVDTIKVLRRINQASEPIVTVIEDENIVDEDNLLILPGEGGSEVIE